MGSDDPDASFCSVVPSYAPPRMLSVIASVGESVRSRSHIALGIVHEVFVV
jgi:hypothetical protein